MFNWTRFPSISELGKEIVILYEDGETRVGMREALSKALRQSGYKCRISEWKFSMLDSPAMLKQAVEDAATAEMIVVCALAPVGILHLPAFPVRPKFPPHYGILLPSSLGRAFRSFNHAKTACVASIPFMIENAD